MFVCLFVWIMCVFVCVCLFGYARIQGPFTALELHTVRTDACNAWVHAPSRRLPVPQAQDCLEWEIHCNMQKLGEGYSPPVRKHRDPLPRKMTPRSHQRQKQGTADRHGDQRSLHHHGKQPGFTEVEGGNGQGALKVARRGLVGPPEPPATHVRWSQAPY